MVIMLLKVLFCTPYIKCTLNPQCETGVLMTLALMRKRTNETCYSWFSWLLFRWVTSSTYV